MKSITLPVPGSTLKLLSKEEIVSRLRTTEPLNKYEFYPFPRGAEHPRLLNLLHESWTADVHPLTLEIAKRLVGESVWVVEGQQWPYELNKADKVKQVVRCNIVSVQGENTVKRKESDDLRREQGMGWFVDFGRYDQVSRHYKNG